MACEGTSDDIIGEALLIRVVKDQVKNVSREEDTVPLGFSEPKLTSVYDQKLFEQLGMTIRVIGDQLDQNQQFNDMMDGLGRVADKSSFWKLVENVFNDGEINWGRIIVLFYSVGKLSAKMVLARLPSMISDILNLSLDYFRGKLLQWICNMGGWINSISAVTRFSIEQFSSSSLSSISPSAGSVMVFITGVLMGVIVMWRLNRSN